MSWDNQYPRGFMCGTENFTKREGLGLVYLVSAWVIFADKPRCGARQNQKASNLHQRNESYLSLLSSHPKIVLSFIRGSSRFFYTPFYFLFFSPHYFFLNGYIPFLLLPWLKIHLWRLRNNPVAQWRGLQFQTDDDFHYAVGAIEDSNLN